MCQLASLQHESIQFQYQASIQFDGFRIENQMMLSRLDVAVKQLLEKDRQVCRGLCGTLKRVVWYFEGDVVL